VLECCRIAGPVAFGQPSGDSCAVFGVDIAAVLELGPHLTHRESQAANAGQPAPMLQRVGCAAARFGDAQLPAQDRRLASGSSTTAESVMSCTAAW